MAIIGIVAVAQNNAIGKDGKLPWHYPADLKHFKETTTGNAVVMGSNTWRSVGKPLADRLNIVLSRRAQIDTADDLIFLRNEDEAIDLSHYLNCDLYVIGGSKIYSALAQHIDTWLVTEIPLTVDGAEVFMPNGYLTGFSAVHEEDLGDGLKLKRYERDAGKRK